MIDVVEAGVGAIAACIDCGRMRPSRTQLGGTSDVHDPCNTQVRTYGIAERYLISLNCHVQ